MKFSQRQKPKEAPQVEAPPGGQVGICAGCGRTSREALLAPVTQDCEELFCARCAVARCAPPEHHYCALFAADYSPDGKPRCAVSFGEAKDQLDHAARLARYRAREVVALERLADAAERIADGLEGADAEPPGAPTPPENIRVKGGGRWPKPGES